MMRTRRIIFGLLTLLLLGLAGVAVQQELAARRLRAELMTLRRQDDEIARLRAEHQVWLEKQIAPAELERLRQEHAELERLRVRIAALHALPLAPAAVVAGTEEGVPANDWRFVGRDTPRAAFESVLWAATHQDIDRLAASLSFDPKTRERAENFFSQLPPETQAQFGSAEKIAATMLAADLPADLSAISTLSDSVKEDSARLFARVERGDGTHRDTFFNFEKAADGWHLIVPPSVLAGYETQLTAGSAAETANTPAP